MIILRILRWLIRTTGQTSRFNHFVNRIHPTFDSLSPANLNAIVEAMRCSPDGDYYEFGVYKGFSLWFAERTAFTLRRQMHFFGFDSFEGLPAPKGVDKRPAVTGELFAQGSFCANQDFVVQCLTRYGADMSRIRLVKGFYDKTLNPSLIAQFNMKRAAVVLVDCDLYESSKTVFSFITPLLQTGTVLLLDDWGITTANEGQQLAFREWHRGHPEFSFSPFMDFGWAGKGFVVNFDGAT